MSHHAVVLTFQPQTDRGCIDCNFVQIKMQTVFKETWTFGLILAVLIFNPPKTVNRWINRFWKTTEYTHPVWQTWICKHCVINMHGISHSISKHTVTLPVILIHFYILFRYFLQESVVEAVESSVNKKLCGFTIITTILWRCAPHCACWCF